MHTRLIHVIYRAALKEATSQCHIIITMVLVDHNIVELPTTWLLQLKLDRKNCLVQDRFATTRILTTIRH